MSGFQFLVRRKGRRGVLTLIVILLAPGYSPLSNTEVAIGYSTVRTEDFHRSR